MNVTIKIVEDEKEPPLPPPTSPLPPPENVEDDVMIASMFDLSVKKHKKSKDKEKDRDKEKDKDKKHKKSKDKEKDRDKEKVKDKKRGRDNDKKEDEEEDEEKEGDEEEARSSETVQGASYLYDDLLARVFVTLESSDYVQQSRILVLHPIVKRCGAKKTAWENYREVSDSLNRRAEHVSAFVCSELSIDASVDKNNHMIMRGIFNTKHIENLIRKYVLNYVQCSMCKSLHTTMERDHHTRTFLMHCQNCRSSRTLQNIVVATTVSGSTTGAATV